MYFLCLHVSLIFNAKSSQEMHVIILYKSFLFPVGSILKIKRQCKLNCYSNSMAKQLDFHLNYETARNSLNIFHPLNIIVFKAPVN